MKKTLLLIGASSELGRAYIKNNIDEYDRIIAHCNSNISAVSELGDDLSKGNGGEINLIPVKADLSCEEDVDKLILFMERLETVPDHIIFLSSPKMNIEHFKKSSYEAYKMHMEVSFFSTVKILITMLPKMAKRKSGKILFMLSKVTDGSAKFQASYASAKYALLGLMKDLSNEYADKGITVNAVSPDMIETGFISNLPKLLVEQNAAGSILSRNLTVDDVVPKMKELLLDDCKINGENIFVP